MRKNGNRFYNFKYMKKILVLGGGGFIGGHLAKALKAEGNWVRVVDIKKHEYFPEKEICDEFIKGDLRDPSFVGRIMFAPHQSIEHDTINSFDEVYQLAADMGGAGYVFTGEHDADIMHNSALINLNVVDQCVRKCVKKVFYSSSACMYPAYNQADPDNPNCKEDSAYPANPDSEYGWEKLFSERLYLAYHRNHGLNVRIARFHNIMGPYGSWNNGKEKAPAAMCRKVAEAPEHGGHIEVWGDGRQTRSFMYVTDCVDAIKMFMRNKSSFIGPVNIGSEEMVTINQLAEIAISISKKNISIVNVKSDAIGVMGRNSDNELYRTRIGGMSFKSLYMSMYLTYHWIKEQVDKQKIAL